MTDADRLPPKEWIPTEHGETGMKMEQSNQPTAVGSTAGLDVPMCTCGTNPATEPHACPYAAEIGGSTDDEYCTCCDECRYQCAMDI